MASSAAAVHPYSYTRYGRGTPRLKARMTPITYTRGNGEEIPVVAMHDFHVVNAIARIRKERAFGFCSARHSALPDLMIEARKRGFTVD